MNNLRKIILKEDIDSKETKYYYFHQWLIDPRGKEYLGAIVENSKGEVGVLYYKSFVFINA